MAGNANPKMEHREIFTGAYRKARQLNRNYPVTKKHIPEGHKYRITSEEMVFKRKTLESIKEFSKSFAKNEFRSKAFNHVHYMELTDYLLCSFAAKAMERAPIREEAYREFVSILRGIFEKEVVPYDVIAIAAKDFRKHGVFQALDALYFREGWKFADFAAAFSEIALEFRKGYSGILYEEKDYLEKMRKRNQPEHALLHAVFFSSLVCCEIDRRYTELEKDGGKAFIL